LLANPLQKRHWLEMWGHQYDQNNQFERAEPSGILDSDKVCVSPQAEL